MDAKEFVGNKIEQKADVLFERAKKEVREKISECFKLMGEYGNYRSGVVDLCRELIEIICKERVKDVSRDSIQKYFYSAAWNEIQSQHKH